MVEWSDEVEVDGAGPVLVFDDGGDGEVAFIIGCDSEPSSEVVIFGSFDNPVLIFLGFSDGEKEGELVGGEGDILRRCDGGDRWMAGLEAEEGSENETYFIEYFEPPRRVGYEAEDELAKGEIAGGMLAVDVICALEVRFEDGIDWMRQCATPCEPSRIT
ncbi:hypothetical protein KS4_07720 [Poriferisphaera corsica]|uniref:Uncharacterized protein n=1 Tax=Poriferisphaera corsica TaxID=2528020 RepID=A0A517YR82_9BACT|nr:hypothetical protein KS4_07720 [Poriferisphaera corsica]